MTELSENDFVNNYWIADKVKELLKRSKTNI